MHLLMMKLVDIVNYKNIEKDIITWASDFKRKRLIEYGCETFTGKFIKKYIMMANLRKSIVVTVKVIAN